MDARVKPAHDELWMAAAGVGESAFRMEFALDSCALLIRLRVRFSIKNFALFPWLVEPVQT
jgi:hypothetical protein